MGVASPDAGPRGVSAPPGSTLFACRASDAERSTRTNRKPARSPGDRTCPLPPLIYRQMSSFGAISPMARPVASDRETVHEDRVGAFGDAGDLTSPSAAACSDVRVTG